MSGRQEFRRSEAQKRDRVEKKRDRDREGRGRHRETRESDVSSSMVTTRATKDSEPREPSIDPTKPKKPPRQPRPETPSPPPPAPPQPPSDSPSQPAYQPTSTTASCPSLYEAPPPMTSLPVNYPTANEYPGALSPSAFKAEAVSVTPQSIVIQINSKNSIEAAISLSTEDSFISETLMKRLKLVPEATSHKRTYQSRSGAKLSSKTRIRATISYNETSLDNKSLYVVADKLGHKVVIGNALWTALQPRTTAPLPKTGTDGQYLSDYSQLPKSMSLLTTGGTNASTDPSSYYPVQAAYTSAATYASNTEQLQVTSQQIQPTLPPYPFYATQPSQQIHSSFPRASEYTSSASQYSSNSNNSSTYSTYATQGSQEPYTTIPTSAYGSSYAAPTSNLASADTYEPSYATKEYNESYTYQPSPNTYQTSYQAPREESQQESWDRVTPHEAPRSEQQLSSSDNNYASVRKWEYQR